jgi:hypothetical protein
MTKVWIFQACYWRKVSVLERLGFERFDIALGFERFDIALTFLCFVLIRTGYLTRKTTTARDLYC